MGILARSEVCQKCARCCKEFTVSGFMDEYGFKKRIDWLCDEKVTMDDNFQLHIKIPCSMLRFNGELYSCAIHEKPERPLLCQDYPDQVPVSAWAAEAELCPIIAEKLEIVTQKNTEEPK